MQTINLQAAKTEMAIEKYTQLVYGIALTELKSKSDADDVFQEVFLLHYNNELEFESDEHEKSWLIRTAINFCKKYNYSTWSKKRAPLDEANAFTLSDVEENRVFEEVRALKPKYSLPIYLKYFENMPTEKIAYVMNISPAAVRKRLSRARAMLKERLECDYFE